MVPLALLCCAVVIATSLCAPCAGMEHPFLIVREDDYETLRRRALHEPWKGMRQRAIADAERLAAANPEAWTERCDHVAHLSSAAALAYIVDPQNAAAHQIRVEDALTRLAALREAIPQQDDWERSVPLGRAIFYGILALDVVHDALPDERRRACEDAIDRLVPVLSRHAWRASFWAVRGTWALYRGDDAAATEAAASYRAYVLEETTADGVYIGGPGYGWIRYSEGWREQKNLFMDVLEHTSRGSFYDDERFRALHEWVFGYTSTPFGETWCFGDTDPDFSSRAVSARRPALYRAHRFGAEAAGLASWNCAGAEPIGLITQYVLMDRPMASPRAPVSRVFRDGGAWFHQREGGERALAAALWNVTRADGHAHKDVNALHLCGFGKHLLRNTGYNGWDAGSFGFDWTYINDRAAGNNVVMIDGRDHRRKVGKGIVEAVLGDGFDYACGDAGDALGGGLHLRSFVMVHPDRGAAGYFVCFDRVDPDDPASAVDIAWHPYSSSVVEAFDGCGHSWDLGDRVRVGVVLGTPPERSDLRDSPLAGSAELLGKALVARYRGHPSGRSIVTAILPSAPGHPAPRTTRLAGGTHGGLRIEHDGDAIDHVVESGGEAEIAIDGIRFRGEATCWRRSGTHTAWYFVRSGTSFDGGDRGFRMHGQCSIFVRGLRGRIVSQGGALTLRHPGIVRLLVDGVAARITGTEDGAVTVELPAGARHLEVVVR